MGGGHAQLKAVCIRTLSVSKGYSISFPAMPPNVPAMMSRRVSRRPREGTRVASRGTLSGMLACARGRRATTRGDVGGRLPRAGEEEAQSGELG